MLSLKAVSYTHLSNTPEAAAPVAYLLSGGLIPLPLTVIQILTIDIGTDMVPALGLGAEAAEANVMQKPPRSKKERLLNCCLLYTSCGTPHGLGIRIDLPIKGENHGDVYKRQVVLLSDI